ncbi:glycosyltransferase [Actinomycetia phage DSL-LC01]|nr:glycosyltransferase [Actinomycetia phage DSL-LC01]
MTKIKVLMTGYTAQHIGSNRKLIKYGAVADLFAEIFEAGGCEVEHRRAIPDEDISGYDLIVCGQISLAALGSTYLYGALDVVSRARENGCGLMFYIDDWQVHNLLTSLKTINKDSNRLVRESLGSARADLEWARAHVDRIFPVAQALMHRPWPVTLVPKFTWGDGTKVTQGLTSREWVYADLSPFAEEFNTAIPSDEDRKVQWVLGVLSDQRKWLEKMGLSWPVEYIGGRSSKADQKLSEKELVDLYAQSWGVLSPKYPHAGSGWWRNRFVYTARTKSIMLADPEEIAPLGEPFLVKGAAIEAMSKQQLRELADAQHKAFFDVQATKDQVIETVMKAVRKSIDEARGA